jgi:hypothetical protein
MDNKDKQQNENNSKEDNIAIKECLVEMKKDLRTLPCQSGNEEDCLQTKNIEYLKEGLANAQTAYTMCHQEKLEPLIKSHALLNQKQDLQQETINRIETKLDALQKSREDERLETQKNLLQLQASLTSQISQIITQRDTASVTKKQMLDSVKWGLGIIVSGATVYGIVRAIIAAIASGIL